MGKRVTNELGIRGLPCPWCFTIIQRVPGGTLEQGLAEHISWIHPERAS